MGSANPTEAGRVTQWVPRNATNARIPRIFRKALRSAMSASALCGHSHAPRSGQLSTRSRHSDLSKVERANSRGSGRRRTLGWDRLLARVLSPRCTTSLWILTRSMTCSSMGRWRRAHTPTRRASTLARITAGPPLYTPVLIDFDKTVIKYPSSKRFPGGASDDLIPDLQTPDKPRGTLRASTPRRPLTPTMSPRMHPCRNVVSA
jgi:hypothetical protein